jgi:uncharacterized protein YkwD
MIQFLSRFAIVTMQSVATCKSRTGLSLILFLILIGPFATADEKKEVPRFEMTKEERTLMDLVNKERAKADLPALRPHPLLFKAARAHSANMAKQEKMEHILDEKKPSQRVEAAGYNWGKVRENLLTADMTDVPPEKIVKAWMDSKDHRINILANDVAETGLGIVRNAKGEAYYTQVFARQRRIKSQK